MQNQHFDLPGLFQHVFVLVSAATLWFACVCLRVCVFACLLGCWVAWLRGFVSANLRVCACTCVCAAEEEGREREEGWWCGGAVH